MKYANITHNGLALNDETRIINLGDTFESIAIERLYEQLGISTEKIVEIDLYELESYQGEEVILPINFMFMPQIMGVNLLNISSKIVPIFLGLALTDTLLTDEQCAFLKKWEPIGCRDERTKNVLCMNGIKAYIGGCLVATLTQTETNPSNSGGMTKKIAFIDVPRFVEPYVPKEITERIEILDHEFFTSYHEICADPAFKKKATERIKYYKNNISMIVTSRFHGAVIGLALNIPTILVAENNFYKYSWLSKLLPFYDSENVKNIDWNPKPVEMSEIRDKMSEIAKARIQNAYAENVLTSELEKMLSNEFRDDSDALRYTASAKFYMKDKWNTCDNIEYAIWGINDNAAELYEYISKYYPNAKLVAIYDGLRERKMAGLVSKTPSEDNVDKDVFVFVASNTANQPAEKLFRKIGKSNYFLCSLEFIKK